MILPMPSDLRKTSCDDVIGRVQHALDTHFNLTTEVRKRRSIGFRTERDTWVRIEIRDIARTNGQAWGVEAASILRGVSMPAWYQGISWLDHDRHVMWHADETEFITDTAIKPGGILTIAPELSESWWTAYNASLAALASHTTTRTATPNLRPITQARVTETIHRVFDGIDTTVAEWTAAHADLAWANLTAPNCYLLDWEDWGMAPRGFDAAMLWSESLAVPILADRVHQERRADLDSPTGRLARLYYCAQLIAAGERSGPLLEPATASAAKLLTDLQP
jgi:hypothetical protein